MSLYRKFNNVFSRSADSASFLLNNESVILAWPKTSVAADNWGDKLNPFFAKNILGLNVFHPSDIYPALRTNVHFWIGSHLAAACSTRNSIVWGAGFIRDDDRVRCQPKEIRSVRGWLSYKKLKSEGLAVPESVGDAALLLPRIYNPKNYSKKYKIGFIPHFRDKNSDFFIAAAKWEDCVLIDVCGDIYEVIDNILSCERIVSSSLHGLICSDAYGVPSLWVEASKNVIGDGFKFYDYFSSVSRMVKSPVSVSEKTTRAEIEDKFSDYVVNVDIEKIISSCPFDIKSRLI